MSFWNDSWSSTGCLKEVLGTRVIINLGTADNAQVSDVFAHHRRRRHRQRILNKVEEEINWLRVGAGQEDDIRPYGSRQRTSSKTFSRQMKLGYRCPILSKKLPGV